MVKRKTHKVLRIVGVVILILVLGCTGVVFWLSSHYKQLIADRLPGIITKSSDSLYHLSFTDISVSIFSHKVTITGLKLWADEKQAAELRKQHRRIPVTLSTVSIPYLEAYGIAWGDLVSNRSFDCKYVVVHKLKWSMLCTPHPEDSLFSRDKKNSPTISRITAIRADFIEPDITYHYKGTQASFDCYMKGGTAVLSYFAYNYDQTKDTSRFIFARSGKVRFNSFTLSKPAGRYVVNTPDLDFETTDTSVTLRSVKIKHLVDYDQTSGKQKEIYNLDFPSIAFNGLNWNRLINDGILRVPKVTAAEPLIDIHYIRANNKANSRIGAYPHQLLLQVGLKTNISELDITKGHFKYNEVTPKGDEGTIEFTGIHGHFENITNMPSVIAEHKSCIVNLTGKFMKKSEISAKFNLVLTDDKGRYTVDGFVKDLDGDEVTPEAQVFTVVKVTSFHLKDMDMHIEGDEAYGKGDFTVKYDDLKISLFKFDTKMRKGKKGLLAFVGSSLVLYKSNPLPGKDVRKVTTSFARDTTKGFIGTIWQHMFRAAKKTAVREQAIVTITDGPETQRGDKPKKGFFTRIFSKKK